MAHSKNTAMVERGVDFCGELWSVMGQAETKSPEMLIDNFVHALSACEVALTHTDKLPNYRRLGATLLSGIDPAVLPIELKRLTEYEPLPKQECADIREIADGFSAVLRLPRFPNGTTEDDLCHSVNLSLFVAGMTEAHMPPSQSLYRLGRGIIMALVHDLPELISGDTVTLGLSSHQMEQKKLGDELALAELMQRYGHLRILQDYLLLYEKQSMGDSRIVYVADKLLPAISHTADKGAVLLGQGVEYDAPEKYFGGKNSETTKKIARPKYTNLPLWLSMYDEVRARAGVATYGMSIAEARQLSRQRSVAHGLVVPNDWSLAA